MDGYKVPFFAAAALLLASAALHLRSFGVWPTAGEQVAPSATAPTASSSTAEPDPGEELRKAKLELLKLRSRLGKCQDQNWDMAGQLARGAIIPNNVPAGKADTAEGTMCEVSNWILRKQWEQVAEPVKELFGKQLGSEAWVDADVEQRLHRIDGIEELAQRDRDELERGYRGMWQRHGERMRRQAATGSWNELADSMRAFWQEEDKMLRDVLGEQRLKEIDRSALAARTALLALAATYAGSDWDEETLTP